MEGTGQFVARRAISPAMSFVASRRSGGLITETRGGAASRASVVARSSASNHGIRVLPAAGTNSTAGVDALLDQATQALTSLRSSAATDAGVLGFSEAADFAGSIEDISRTVEYLQIIAAHAVERTRREARNASPVPGAGAAPGWQTGWSTTTTPGPVAPPPTGHPHTTAIDASAGTIAGAGAGVGAVVNPTDDGYRNAAEFLRARLRISISEARRRLALAAEVLPQTGMTGQHIPARREILADALVSAQVPSRSATIISTALNTVRHLVTDETAATMEQALTTTAIDSDP
ncbi:HNH endonuclease, partial [Paenarthrobacter sp. NPDC056912]